MRRPPPCFVVALFLTTSSTVAAAVKLLLSGGTRRRGDTGEDHEDVVSKSAGIEPSRFSCEGVGAVDVPVRLHRADGDREATLRLTLATTKQELERGYMYRSQQLGPPSKGTVEGMAFVYTEPHRGVFWMHNTFIPLAATFWSETGALLGKSQNMTPMDDTYHWAASDACKYGVETAPGALERALGLATAGGTQSEEDWGSMEVAGVELDAGVLTAAVERKRACDGSVAEVDRGIREH